MWIKLDTNPFMYEPELINIETGARIYYEYEEDKIMDCSIDKLMYEHPNLEERIILKKDTVYTRQCDEDDDIMPFTDEIDRIYEALKKGEKTFELQ